MTRDLERSHVKLIAHRMRENCRRNKKMAKVCCVLPCSPDTSSLACLTAEPNQLRLTHGGGYRLYIQAAWVPCCWQTEGLREASVWVMFHGKSQQATCFSILCLFYFTGLWATSQLGQLPLRKDSAWMTCTGSEAYENFCAGTHFPCTVSFFNVIFNETKTTSSHIRLNS